MIPIMKMQQKKILITGVTGQIGSYLSEICVANSMDTFGMVRRCSRPRLDNLDFALSQNRFEIVEGDLQDQGSLSRLIRSIEPDFVVNCAAQSFVKESWNSPVNTGDVTGLGVTRLLEAIRENQPEAIFLQMSSSEMFGDVAEEPQNEDTVFNVRSPYGAAKLYAHWIAVNYRQSYDMNTRCAICFNSESARRGDEFVTQKIVTHLAEVAFGVRDCVELGNMQAKRDWTDARDTANALFMMLAHDENEDFVIGSGEHHTVSEFFNLGYKYVVEEAAFYLDDEHMALPAVQDCYKINKKFFRPADVNTLLADATKIKGKLGWTPTVSFEDMVRDMAKAAVEKIYERIFE